METPDRIQSILESGESQRLEFKVGRVSLEALGSTICAFLNSGGGQIIIGVNDQGIVEQQVSKSEIEKLLQPLAGGNGNTSLITPNAVWDITEEPTSNSTIVMIDVPAGIDTPYVFRDSIYIRSRSRTKVATGTQIRALIEKRYLQGARWERQPILGVSLDDLDDREILKTARIATDRRGWQFTDIDDLSAILIDLNLMHHGDLTHAAVVLFAKEAGHILPQCHSRLTTYKTDKGDTEIVEDMVMRGHLFNQLDGYNAFIERHVSVSSELSAAKNVREDRPQYPYWSLREGYRNALMHRDYESMHGRLSVGFYSSKIEIWNTGGLPKGLSIKDLKNADRSIPVNPDIAQVVFLRGLVELLGRGTRKITEEFNSQGLPEPIWKKQAGGVTLTMQSRAASGAIPSNINKRQIDLLRNMRPGEDTDAEKYAKLHTELSERTIRNDISKLVQLGLLAKQGQSKSTFYVRTEKSI